MTYAWADNKDGDVDFIAQDLEHKGLTVKLDRWNIGAGRRLWEQIESFIQQPAESDAWVLYATQASLGSEPCREEYAYALDRALTQRSGTFAVAAIFPGTIDASILPAGLRTRLCVSLTDRDWAERIAAAVEGRAHSVARINVEPFFTVTRSRADGGYNIEVRPRAGTWVPFTAAIPKGEEAEVQMSLSRGAAGGKHLDSGVLAGVGWGTSPDGQWFYWHCQEEATPTVAYYIHCSKLPTELLFGVEGQLFKIFPTQGANVTLSLKK
ncbi:MAG: toll/interleukin-1 receptor domain-containing protein [Luteibacter jiangsuensis]